jgi:hypothetical protein
LDQWNSFLWLRNSLKRNPELKKGFPFWQKGILFLEKRNPDMEMRNSRFGSQQRFDEQASAGSYLELS